MAVQNNSVRNRTRWRRRVAVVMAALALTSACATGTGLTPGHPPSRPVAEAAAGFDSAGFDSGGFDSATRDDAEFNRQFRHEFVDVDGLRMHYVTGGTGPPLVLLHGWPQSWYAWRGIMPTLAEQDTVYALDLPGLGDIEEAPPSYDKATLARYVQGLISDRLGLHSIRLVAHDLGAGVGFQYAAQYRNEVIRYAHLDYPLPGPGLSAGQFRSLSWHIAFHVEPKVPEAIVADDVREYLALFYPQVSYGGESFGGTRTTSPFTDAQIDEFARTYSRPQVLHGGFELYRTVAQDERDNTAAAAITMPTMLMTAQGSLSSFSGWSRPG